MSDKLLAGKPALRTGIEWLRSHLEEAKLSGYECQLSAGAMRDILYDAIKAHEFADLLTSARSIAERHGEDTAWERFSKRIESFGISWVTPKTFRILPSDKP